MKTKNKAASLFISFLLVFSSVFIAVPQGVSASSGNDIIKGGFNTKQQFKNKFDQAAYVFAHYKIQKNDIDSLKEGTVHKNGNVFVGNEKVATDARSIGRTKIKANDKPVRVNKDKPVVYERSTNTSFSSSQLPALVKLDKDGIFQYAVIKDCANPTTGTPTKKPPKPKKPSIKINKSVNKGSVLLGEQFTYTISTRNTGEVALKNVTINDSAPKGIEFVPENTEKAKGMAIGKQNLKISVGNLAIGQSSPVYQVKAKFTRESNQYVPNKACVNGETPAGISPNKVSDCATAQNKTTDVNINIKKVVSKKVVKVGEEFDYTVTVKNNSAKDLTNLRILDVANEKIELIPGSGTNGATVTSTMFYKLGVSLKKGQTQTFTFKAKFKEAVPTDVINRVCIATQLKEEFCATAQNRPELPIEITKTVNKPEVKIGEEFMYTIALTNTTAADISNVYLLDFLLTKEVELISASGTNGLAATSSWTAIRNGFVLKAGEMQTFTLKAKYKEGVAAGFVGINQVCAEARPTTNTVCATASNKPITPTPPSITITKDASKEQINIGEVFTYSVKVTNTSETDIPAMNMLDAEPEGIEFISGSATNGAFINEGDPFKTGTNSTWFGKANFLLKASETQEFSFQAKLTKEVAGEIVNVVCANNGATASACDDAKNVMAPIEPPIVTNECVEGIPVGDERCIPTEPGVSAPAVIASTGPGAIAASIVGISALGYGARQWMASRRAMHDAMDSLYRKE